MSTEMIQTLLFFGTFWLILLVMLVALPAKRKGLTREQRQDVWWNYQVLDAMDNDKLFNFEVEQMRNDDRFTAEDIQLMFANRQKLRTAKARAAKMLGIEEK